MQEKKIKTAIDREISDNYNLEANLKKINFENLDMETISLLVQLGNRLFSFYNHDSIKNLEFSGYKILSSGESIPFIVCLTNKGSYFVVDEFKASQIGGEHALISNKNVNYINDNGVYCENVDKFNLMNEIKHNVSLSQTDENSDRIENALKLSSLYSARLSVNSNKGLAGISNASKILNGDKIFYIEKNFAMKNDINSENGAHLFYAYASEEGYQNGESPIAISGEVSVNSQYQESCKFANFIKDDSNNYVMLKSDNVNLPYFDTYDEFSATMSQIGLSDIPTLVLFNERVKEQKYIEPEYFKSIVHMMNLRKLCNSDGTVVTNYVANVDGIETSFNNNSFEYRKSSSK